MWFEPQMTDLQRPFQVLDSFQYTGGNGGRRDPSDVSFHVRVSQYVLLRWLLSHLSPGGTKVTADKSPLAQHQLSRVPIEVRRKQQLSDMNVKWDVCWPLLMACIILLSRLSLSSLSMTPADVFSLWLRLLLYSAEKRNGWIFGFPHRQMSRADYTTWQNTLWRVQIQDSIVGVEKGEIGADGYIR
jgi:hypothetical protein